MTTQYRQKSNAKKKEKQQHEYFLWLRFSVFRERYIVFGMIESNIVVFFRNMIRNVSLGHGLFDLINKEKQSKVSVSTSVTSHLQISSNFIVRFL